MLLPGILAGWRRSCPLLETEFFPAGAREQAVRAEKVLVQPPALVRARREASCEEVRLVFAQAGFVANFFEDALAFFFHVVNINQISGFGRGKLI